MKKEEFLPAPALAQFKAAHEAMKDAQLVLQTIGVCFGLTNGDTVDSMTGKITRKTTNEITTPIDTLVSAGDGTDATAEV